MKEGKISRNITKTTEPHQVIPFISNNSALSTRQSDKISEVKDGGVMSNRRKSKPKRFISHKNNFSCQNPGYSDYKALKLRETYRQRQVDFVEGKCRGMRVLITNLEPSKHFK